MHNGVGVVVIGAEVTVMAMVTGMDVVGGMVAMTAMMEMMETTMGTIMAPLIRQRWACRPQK